MQYLGLTAFNELGNGSVNDRQVDIAVTGISLRSVMACSKMCIRDRYNMTGSNSAGGHITFLLRQTAYIRTEYIA